MMHFKIISKSRKIVGQFYLMETQDFVFIKILSLLTNPIFWLLYKGHRNSKIPDLLNIFLKFSFPQIQDRIRDVVEVWFISGRLLRAGGFRRQSSPGFWLQLVHTRTGWSQPRDGTARRSGEHSSHTPWPQARQWCLDSLAVNSRWQLWHDRMS